MTGRNVILVLVLTAVLGILAGRMSVEDIKALNVDAGSVR